MNNLVLIFAFIIPILLVSTSFLGYRYYLIYNKRVKIVNTLLEDSNKILEETKKKAKEDKNNMNWLRSLLYHAGFSQSYVEVYFVLISLCFGILTSVFISLVVDSKVILSVLFILASLFPLLILKKMIDSRREDFNFGLKIIIDKVTSMMKSGVGFEQSLKKSVLTSRSKFTREVFNIYLNEKDIIGEAKCFQKMFHTVESKELRIFYLVISIGKQSGGKFSNTLETLRKTLHDQEEIKQQIVSSTQEIRIGSYMIVALVIFIYMMLNQSLDNSLNEHFFESEEGNIQMFIIILWIAFGLFVNKLLAKVK
jgi:tight adherence protein B